MNSSAVPSLDQFVVGGTGRGAFICSLSTLDPLPDGRIPMKRPAVTLVTVCGCCSVTETQMAFSFSYPSIIRIRDLSAANSLIPIDPKEGVGRKSVNMPMVVELAGHRESVYKIIRIPLTEDDAHDDAWHLVSGSADFTVRLWSGESGRELAKCSTTGPVFNCLRYSCQSHRVYFGLDRGGGVLGWNLDTLNKLELKPPRSSSNSPVRAVALDEENEIVYADSSDRFSRSVNVYSPDTSPHPVSCFSYPEYAGIPSPEASGSMTDMFFHPQSRSILIYTEGGVHVIDSRRMEQPIRSFLAQPRNSDSLSEISQVGERTFLSVNGSKVVSRWTLEGKVEKTHVFSWPLYAIYSPYRSQMKNDGSLEDEILRIDFVMEGHFVEVKIAIGELLLIAPALCLRDPC